MQNNNDNIDLKFGNDLIQSQLLMQSIQNENQKSKTQCEKAFTQEEKKLQDERVLIDNLMEQVINTISSTSVDISKFEARCGITDFLKMWRKFFENEGSKIFLAGKNSNKDLNTIIQEIQNSFCVFAEQINEKDILQYQNDLDEFPIYVDRVTMGVKRKEVCPQCKKYFNFGEKIIIFKNMVDNHVIEVGHLDGDCGLVYKNTEGTRYSEELLLNKVIALKEKRAITMIQKKLIDSLKEKIYLY